MQRSYALVALLVVAAVALVIVGVLYQTGNLQIAAKGSGSHVKHALVAYGCALLALVAANFARPRATA